MTQRRKLEIKPDVPFYAEPDDRPIWQKHYIKNRHNYANVLIFNCTDLDRYDEGIDYLAELTEELFSSPVVSQATFYDDNLGSGEGAKEMHEKLKAYQGRLQRGGERGKLDWMIYLRFSAVDYDAVQSELRAHIEAAFKKMPTPDYLEKVNSIYYIENHLMVRHEDYDSLSTAAGIGVEGEPGTNKFASFGFSKPAENSTDPKTQVAYIDWYQEVRQHDSMRGNFPDEVGRMWLQISAEKPFDYWCLTTYEFCVRDLAAIKTTIGAAYYAMNTYRGDLAHLYDPYYEGTGMVVAEYMKPY
jgi:hypothetical protein